MKFWSKVKSFFQSSNVQNGWSGPGYDFSLWAGSAFGGLSNANLSTNETIFSVITRLANTVSSLPIHLYNNSSQQSGELDDLLTVQTNNSISAYDFFNQMEVSRNSNGNGYALIQRDVLGSPIALYPIKPDCVTPMINLDDYSLWYQISDDFFHAIVFNTEVIHVKHISPVGGITGISPIAVLKNSLDFNSAVQDFSLTEMNKKDSYVIKYDKNVSEEKKKAYIADFARMIKENGGAVFQEKGFEYDRFQSEFKSSDLKDTESITITRIANVYNVPITFLNQSNSSGINSNEQLMAQFVQMTLIPIVRQYETEFNRKLLTQSQRSSGFYFKFNLNGLLRGDTAARTNFYQMLVRNGLASLNDISKLEDLPLSNDPNADKRYVSGDLYPVDMDPAERNAKQQDNVDKTVMTINERREAQGQEPIEGGDAIYMPSSDIPSIDTNDASNSNKKSTQSKGGDM
ncbi:phage portal protein [Liquorilactobacillus nagelii]|uniref:phage portal protein n=1 Tax=Liquorilactobacillus nagelii TaxID=82688 RepID=UPI00242CB050|nr:phage portal protein [Liquorilactobacillus nagelii]MCI1700001.1 phage portal protein [Liquorilactobacillus nagelii]